MKRRKRILMTNDGDNVHAFWRQTTDNINNKVTFEYRSADIGKQVGDRFDTGIIFHDCGVSNGSIVIFIMEFYSF